MIGQLKGIVESIGTGGVLLDVNGVGYMVEGSTRLLAALPAQGEAITLAIEPYIREDQFRLFGFLSEEERSWFRFLLNVQGVGVKVALAIQGVLSADELAHAVATQDKETIARAPGVGAKVAQRIVQELKDKVPESVFIKSASGAIDGAKAQAASANSAAMADALSALGHLGYTRAQAQTAVLAVPKQAAQQASAEDLIRLALRELGK